MGIVDEIEEKSVDILDCDHDQVEIPYAGAMILGESIEEVNYYVKRAVIVYHTIRYCKKEECGRVEMIINSKDGPKWARLIRSKNGCVMIRSRIQDNGCYLATCYEIEKQKLVEGIWYPQEMVE